MRRCDREAVLRSESGMRRMLTNPFKSTIPLIGDYDINVLLEALKIKQCRVSLHAVFNPKVSQAVASLTSDTCYSRDGPFFFFFCSRSRSTVAPPRTSFNTIRRF